MKNSPINLCKKKTHKNRKGHITGSWLAEQQVKITERKGREIGLNIDWMPDLVLKSLSCIFP